MTDRRVSIIDWAVISTARSVARTARFACAPPLAGEHTDGVLKAHGFTRDEIAQVREVKAIKQGDGGPGHWCRAPDFRPGESGLVLSSRHRNGEDVSRETFSPAICGEELHPFWGKFFSLKAMMR
jgi:hypothetical protein